MTTQTVTETNIFDVGLLKILNSLMTMKNWQEDLESHEILPILDD